MTPADIDRVFGRSRLRMVTGDHVEVFREASLPGERRRYTKRFLATPEGDFREWTEREWRILARLVGHGIKPVPDVVQFDRGAADRAALVQTFDAGITVDHWATLLPLERDGALLRNVFEDCAHWWSLARHSLIALDAIHELHLVHLDLKADNVCIPVGPADFDPFGGSRSLHPRFEDITLIDFAFSLVSGERLKSALPIAAQLDYEYQSPRLLLALEAGRQGDLGPTRQLDWRCDLFSVAAMLWRYLPELESAFDRAWTPARHAKASALVRRLIESHDSELPATRPHAELIALASEPLTQPDLRHSLQRGWTLAIDTTSAARAAPTPITRIALPLAAPVTPVAQQESSVPFEHEAISVDKSDIDFKAIARGRRDLRRRTRLWWGAGGATAALVGLALAAQTWLVPPAKLTAADVHSARVDVAPAAIATAPSSPSMQAKPKPAAVVDAPAPVVAAAPQPGPAPPPERALPATAAPPAPTVTPDPMPRRPATAPNAARIAAMPSASRERGSRVASIARAAPAGGAADRATSASSRLAATRAAQSAPVRANAPAAVRVAAFPSPATVVAQARVKALLQQQAEAQARKNARIDAPAPAAAPEPAYPWAVAGKPPPGGAVAPSAKPPPATTPGTPSSALPTKAAPPEVADPLDRTIALLSAGNGSIAPVAARAAGSVDAAPVDFSGRADDLMTNHVPRLAQRAERLVSRVLLIAARSEDVVGDRDILDSAASLGGPSSDPVLSMAASPSEARQFDEAARNEYARHGASAQALALQTRAFGANPLDPDIAGNLAFLLLRQRPSQPEAARQMALHALTVHGSRYPQGRSEDWGTLAIASALVGKDRDARNALLVSLAMAPNLDRQCRAAIDTFSLYGERLRGPVEAMLYSAHASPRAHDSSFCEWPPHWTVGSGPRF